MKGNTMKTLISSILIATGIILAAGSAGDCDGKCMEYANSLSEMIMYGFIGISLMALGGAIAISENNS